MLLILARGTWVVLTAACFVYVAYWTPAYMRAAREHGAACQENSEAIDAHGDTWTAYRKTFEAFERTWEPFNNIMAGAFAGLIMGMLGKALF